MYVIEDRSRGTARWYAGRDVDRDVDLWADSPHHPTVRKYRTQGMATAALAMLHTPGLELWLVDLNAYQRAVPMQPVVEEPECTACGEPQLADADPLWVREQQPQVVWHRSCHLEAVGRAVRLAAVLAKDGPPGSFRVGYSFVNAVLAAVEQEELYPEELLAELPEEWQQAWDEWQAEVEAVRG